MPVAFSRRLILHVLRQGRNLSPSSIIGFALIFQRIQSSSKTSLQMIRKLMVSPNLFHMRSFYDSASQCADGNSDEGECRVAMSIS